PIRPRSLRPLGPSLRPSELRAKWRVTVCRPRAPRWASEGSIGQALKSGSIRSAARSLGRSDSGMLAAAGARTLLTAKEERSEGGLTMSWVVKSCCRTAIRAEDPAEVVVKAQDHAKSKHALTVTRERVRAMAEREG